MESGVLMLKRLGYHVTSCLSSIEAWTLFKEKPEDFDVVVTDQTMPNMTGIELAQKLRTIRPETPIIMYSGYGEAVLDSELKAAKIDLFLAKPVLGSDIARAIRRVFPVPK
jgi:CheY-like chemotaxis protein